MKRTFTIAASVLVAAAIASPGARAESSAPNIASYLHRTPTVLGSVASTTDRSVTIETGAGERLEFVVDSRSVVPPALDEGAQVRIEFRALSDQVFHAQRIIPLSRGEIRALEEQQGASPRMRASSAPAPDAAGGSIAMRTEAPAPAAEAGASGGEAPQAAPEAESASEAASGTIESPAPEAATPSGEASTMQGREPEPATEAVPAEPAPDAASDSESERGLDELPLTTSPRPLIGALALLAIAAAAGIELVRRRRRA